MEINFLIQSLTISVLLSLHLITVSHALVLYKGYLNAYPKKVTYEEGLRICKSEGMNLVRIENEESNKIVYDFALSNGLIYYWIDGTYSDSKSKWLYSDGLEITFSLYEHENDKQKDTKCIQRRAFLSTWEKTSCNSKKYVICHGDPERFSSNQLVIIPGKKTYQQAIRACKARGYNLVKIQSDDINHMVFHFGVRNKLGRYWIDGNDIAVEGKWVYDDGSSLVYSKWHKNEPNNFGIENCIQGAFYGNDFWNDIKCDRKNAVICYANPERFSSNELVIIPGNITYQEAIRACKGRGYNLVKIESEVINQIVYRFAVRNKLSSYWIDGNDIAVEGKWVYDDGMSLVYSKWYKNEPNNFDTENCIHGSFFDNGFWNDIKCDYKNSAICYAKKRYQNEMIAFPNQVNYVEALQLCKSEGLHLVQIENDTSNEMVYNFAINNRLGTYWIDGNDKDEEGKWVYSDGRDLTYSKWYRNEPSNDGNENCIHGARLKNSFWNDVSCQSKNTVICTGDPVIRYTENNFIHLPGQMKYQGAINLCKNHGYNLVKIQNEDVNQMVFNFAVKKKIGKYWIDGNDKDDDGRWIYNDGAEMVYSKWFGGEPSNYRNNENCIVGLYYQNEFWKDIHCDLYNSVICYSGTLRV